MRIRDGKNSDPWSRINIPYPQHCFYVVIQILWQVKPLNIIFNKFSLTEIESLFHLVGCSDIYMYSTGRYLMLVVACTVLSMYLAEFGV